MLGFLILLDDVWDSGLDDGFDDGYDTGMSGGDGMPGIFAVLFVLVIVLGVAGTIWRVSAAQRMAREAGMSQSDATAMALLSDDGLEATYLAASLRGPAVPPAAEPAAAPESAATRLRELRELLDQELITQAEHDTRRQAIIDSV
ncbi:SHOCT domain-containing protein [Nocardioides sp. URHA0020]|uniref:SHOCT domain-containing protein n=1 Tax=Nocardioides sp. URHA0020 TaxID=1380392 RepID=UPI00049159D1|nr:SHOCT domain-containing protein [Nocardioides sp. URHA0020]